MEATLTLVAAILAGLAAAVAGRGALLARSFRPELATHVRELVNIVSDVLAHQATWYQHARSQGTPQAAQDPYLSAIAHSLQELSRINETAVPKLQSLRSFADQEIEAAEARSWIQLGTLLALASAATQLFLLALKLMQPDA